MLSVPLTIQSESVNHYCSVPYLIFVVSVQFVEQPKGSSRGPLPKLDPSTKKFEFNFSIPKWVFNCIAFGVTVSSLTNDGLILYDVHLILSLNTIYKLHQYWM